MLLALSYTMVRLIQETWRKSVQNDKGSSS